MEKLRNFLDAKPRRLLTVRAWIRDEQEVVVEEPPTGIVCELCCGLFGEGEGEYSMLQLKKRGRQGESRAKVGSASTTRPALARRIGVPHPAVCFRAPSISNTLAFAFARFEKL